MSRPESAVLHAERELLSVVAECRARAQPFLPTVSTLARRCHVSRVTILKALHRLRDAGVVGLSPRRGACVTGDPTAVVPTPYPKPIPHTHKLPAWSELTRTIAADIAAGRYAPGGLLPSAKELRARYGVGHRTLTRALVALVKRLRITRHGRTYAAGSTTAHAAAALVFAAANDDMRQLAASTPLSAELWRTLEQECRRRSLRLVVSTFEHLARKRTGVDRPLGYLFSTITPSPDLRDRALSHTAASGLPVAILQETTLTAAEIAAPTAPFVRRYLMFGGDTAGRLVGHYLLDRGHRCIAFLAQLDDTGSRSRHESLRRALDEAGLADSLTFHSVWPGRAPDMGSDRSFVRLRRIVTDAESRFASAIGAEAPESEIVTPTWRFAERALASVNTRPFFERLLRDTPATAWVCFNDDLGVLALRFLSGQRMPAPARISVVGYDDTLEAFGVGLSSYDFNVRATVTAALDHLAAPVRRPARSPQPIELPGMVMERPSSGRAPRF